ncbi:DUF1330 domain-containing protein [Mycobacterium paraterrae]|uniref:DUF1330 domain-containing protein n=1 Tax=Mycobacterium paraterrae TaxID=577492 RepID=A0ABY3VRF5_9MYCO|nr:DUF1330 domain-containing protein [Mycobacterium paraterrae]UMB69752.1 DUF1330 domain-containing protein [Mycobacterium paraterrae]
MSAYAIFIRQQTHDPASLAHYADAVATLLEDHPVKVLALYGKCNVLEGDLVEGAVILEFPTLEAAKAWYGSAAYAQILPLRLDGATYSSFIVEGI